jgi:hypothetical protein
MTLPIPGDDFSPDLVPASWLTQQPLSWLWPGRLAFGKLAVLDGDPGLGKSLIALDLCARLSTGRPLPDGSAGPGPVRAAVFNAEDDPDDTLCPRLGALGADLDRILVWRRHEAEVRPLSLPKQVGPLEEAVARWGARLVVVDPVTAFVAPGAISNDAAMRAALAPLAVLAARHDALVLLLRHLNKRSGLRAGYRGAGSIGLSGMCRSCWLAAHEPQTSGRCVLAEVKNSLGPLQPSLAYEVKADADSRPVVCWGGVVGWSADDLVGPGTVKRREEPRDRARALLVDLLARGPRLLSDIWAEVQKAGLSESTLRRAAEDLSVRSQRVCREGRVQAWWLLPRQELPETPEGVPSLEKWIAPLREKYPPLPPETE